LATSAASLFNRQGAVLAILKGCVTAATTFTITSQLPFLACRFLVVVTAAILIVAVAVAARVSIGPTARRTGRGTNSGSLAASTASLVGGERSVLGGERSVLGVIRGGAAAATGTDVDGFGGKGDDPKQDHGKTDAEWQNILGCRPECSHEEHQCGDTQ
jgi:hypothetical protein